MTDRIARRAGDAVLWQAIQFGGVKLLYLLRIVVLARLLPPADFGLFAVALVALDFLLSVTNFGMVPALIQRPDATREHYESAWTVGLLRAGAVGLGLAMLAPWVAEVFGEPTAAPLLRVLALRPVVEAAASIGVAELEKNLKFRSIAFLKLTATATNAAVSIALVAPMGMWALVAGPVAGATAYAVLSYMLAPIMPRIRLRGAAAGHLASYGRWILLTAWVVAAGQMLLRLGISRQLGAVALGLYFMAIKVASLPSDIASQVVATVTFPVFSMVQADADRARRVFRSALLGLIAVAVPASMLIFVLAPSLAADLLGERWVPAVPVIRIVAATGILGLFGDIAVPLLKGVGRPERTARMELVQYSVLVVFAHFLAGPWGITGVASAWIPAVLASQVLGLVYVRSEIGLPFAGLARPIVGVFAAALIGAAVGLATDYLLGGAIGVIVALLVGTVAGYLTLLGLETRIGFGLAADAASLFPWSVPLLRRLGLGHRLSEAG